MVYKPWIRFILKKLDEHLKRQQEYSKELISQGHTIENSPYLQHSLYIEEELKKRIWEEQIYLSTEIEKGRH